MSFLQYNSLPAMFVATCEKPGYKGFFDNAENSWIEYRPAELIETLKKLVSAFKQLNIAKGTGVGIIAKSCPQWILTDLAIQICGGITIPLFHNIAEENFVYQCKDANVKHILVASIDFLDEDLQAHLHEFENIFSLKARQNKLDNEISWESLLKLGEKNPIDEVDFLAYIKDIDADDVFSIIYTSGSTGMPKGVPLTHRNMISQFAPLKDRLSEIPEHSNVLSVLPIAHVFERAVTYYYIFIGATIHFGEDPKQLSTLLKDVKPVIITVVPRLLERVYEKILKLSRTAPYPKRFLLKKAIRYAQITNPAAHKKYPYLLYEKLVYSTIRKNLGDNLRYIISGSSALNKNICQFFLNMGLPICEGYGMTETSPVISLNINEQGRPGSVGMPLDTMELKLSEDGEILVRGESVFKGYHNLGEENGKFFTEDGFFKTGDSGFFGSNGDLYLTGRIKEMLKTSTGKYVSPVPIEDDLCQNQIISSACVIANNRKFVSALFFLQPEAVRQLLNIDGNVFSMEKAIQSNHVKEAIEKCVTKVNKHLNYWEQIRKWIILPDIPDICNGMLTPTLKLRRREVEKIYLKEIEKMYEEDA